MSEEIKRNPSLQAKDPRAIFMGEFPDEALMIINSDCTKDYRVQGWLVRNEPMSDGIPFYLWGITRLSAMFWVKAQENYDLHVQEMDK